MQKEVEGQTHLCGPDACIGIILGDGAQEVGESHMQGPSHKGGGIGLSVVAGGEACVSELKSSRANSVTVVMDGY